MTLILNKNHMTSDKVSVYRVTDNVYAFQVDNPNLNLPDVRFQRGARGEVGVNGVTVDDLFVVCIDYLKGWQDTDTLANDHTANVITHLEQALHYCNLRHADRIARGVSGTYKA